MTLSSLTVSFSQTISCPLLANICSYLGLQTLGHMGKLDNPPFSGAKYFFLREIEVDDREEVDNKSDKE